MIGFTITSLVIFAVFVSLSIYRFNLLDSYSSYAKKWDEIIPMNTDTHLWSIVTVVTALLMFPPLFEHGAENPWNFLGLFAAGYLIVVGMTPKYQTEHKQRVIHIIGAVCCALVSWLWLILVAKAWWLPLAFIAVVAVPAYFTKKPLFWLEMAMFAAVFTKLLA